MAIIFLQVLRAVYLYQLTMGIAGKNFMDLTDLWIVMYFIFMEIIFLLVLLDVVYFRHYNGNNWIIYNTGFDIDV